MKIVVFSTSLRVREYPLWALATPSIRKEEPPAKVTAHPVTFEFGHILSIFVTHFLNVLIFMFHCRCTSYTKFLLLLLLMTMMNKIYKNLFRIFKLSYIFCESFFRLTVDCVFTTNNSILFINVSASNLKPFIRTEWLTSGCWHYQ